MKYKEVEGIAKKIVNNFPIYIDFEYNGVKILSEADLGMGFNYFKIWIDDKIVLESCDLGIDIAHLSIKNISRIKEAKKQFKIQERLNIKKSNDDYIEQRKKDLTWSD